MISRIARILVATLALMAAQGISAAVILAAFGTEGFPAGVAGSLPYQVVANLLIVVVLAWFAQRSHWRGWRLAGALAIVLYGIFSFTSIIEAVFFGFLSARIGVVILLMTALSTAIFTPALLLFAKKGAPGTASPEWRLRLTPGRVATGSAAYLVIYFAFGMMVFPFIADFYTGMGTPPPLQMIGMALLVRGPIFVALAALVIAMSGARRTETILMVAVAMSVIGGVAPLIVPNSLFPDPVRWAHFVEVTTENFLFGGILGFLLTRRTSPAVELPAPVEVVPASGR
jgi:hypothetical protein